jgi:hypothetical protein
MTASNAWKQLAMELGHWVLRGYGMWSLESRSTGEMVGGCGFWWPGGWPRPELTWWFYVGRETFQDGIERNVYSIPPSRIK